MGTIGPSLNHRTGLPSFDATRRLVLPTVRLMRPFAGDFGLLRQQTAPGPDGWAASTLATPPNHVLVLVEAAQHRPYEVRFGGRRMTVAAQADSLMVLPHGLDREWRAKDRRDAVLYVNIAPAWLERLAEEEGMAPHPDLLPLVTDHVDETTRRLLALLRQAPEEGDPALFLEQWAVLAGRHALGLGRRPRNPERRRMAISPARLARVKAHVEEHLAEPLSLGELAAIAGLSRFHFARVFRTETGQTPHGYVMRRRCERAKLLLSGTEAPRLAEVAVSCGFAHQAHLTTVFRRIIGTTPGRWRAAMA